MEKECCKCVAGLACITKVANFKWSFDERRATASEMTVYTSDFPQENIILRKVKRKDFRRCPATLELIEMGMLLSVGTRVEDL